jgi:hypothetical protein
MTRKTAIRLTIALCLLIAVVAGMAIYVNHTIDTFYFPRR